MGLFIAIINIKYNIYIYNIIYMYISTLNYIIYIYIYIYYIKHAFLSSA